MRSPVTTHILDVSRGKPAGGIPVILEKQNENVWKQLSEGVTNSDGRVENLLQPGSHLEPGNYKLIFHVESYYQGMGIDSFYPEVSVIFKLMKPSEHYHLPLLLSPFGFSTYRGT